MSPSILNSTKKVLGLAEDYTVFDQDVIVFINSAFSTLNQLGLGPVEGFWITGEDEEWDDYPVEPAALGMVRSYVFLKTRVLFDPPNLSYLATAMQQQIEEMEWRLNIFREGVDLSPEGAVS
jgi:hypothetical protein